MAGHINTSIGSLEQSLEILQPNPGFPSRGDEPITVGSITCGTDVYTIKHKNEFGPEVTVLKNGAVQGSPYVDFPYSKVGFANRYREGVGTVFFYVACNDATDLPSTIVENTGGGAYPYAALTLGSYNWDDIAVPDQEWDESPSTDINDPGNMDIRGGEEANTMPFDTNDLQVSLPTPSAWDYDISKLCTLYRLDSTQLAGLGSALFDNDFWTDLKNKFSGLSDPLSMMLSVYQLPISGVGSATTFKLGGIELEASGTPISCNKITARYASLTFGEIWLKEVWGTAKDYTDIELSIFLPFCGEKSLDPEIVVAGKLSLSGYLDMWTGDVVYLLKVKKSTSAGYFTTESVPYRWTGNCAKKFPIGRVDTTGAIMNLVASGLQIAGGAALSAATGNAAGLVGAAAGAANMLGTGVRPNVQSSGNVSGAAGYMDFTYPYLMIKRGVPQYPNNWRAHIGAPRYQEFLIASLTGFTSFAEVHVDSVTGATNAEKTMIENELKSGVYL